MNTFFLKGTDDTPSVILDPANNLYEFSGRSLPEDVSAFYKPIISWFKETAVFLPGEVCIKFNLEYFNTASSKAILDVLFQLETLRDAGHDIKIKWYFDTHDESMHEAGEEYKELVSLDFEILPR
ncbi:MAG: hypothetical protein A3H98_02055 [Bacteroidetes bacterium RIFCSPLOWO2_02_FULL_36_8]|nr:MAG: hypothetical protein A3H98_02055 [Bacteroidetes bacterium RIFCSPLOWO2_02_FULL_36_8]OFY69223.1 MAG: hypothetical protein A3G23_06660 [Bacteroidetes bacterium RIFCSPLOWO2_12_FULL_37_12]